MRHDFVLILANEQIFEVKLPFKLIFWSALNLLDFFLLEGDPNVFVLLVFQDFWGEAQLGLFAFLFLGGLFVAFER